MKLSISIKRLVFAFLGFSLGLQPVWIFFWLYQSRLQSIHIFVLCLMFMLPGGLILGLIPMKFFDGVISSLILGILAYFLSFIIWDISSWSINEFLEILVFPISVVIGGNIGAAIRLYINKIFLKY